MARLAARHGPEARYNLFLVHAQTRAPLVLHLHRALLRGAVSVTPLPKRSLSDVLQNGRSIAGPAAPWRQYRVLEGRPTKFSTGLDRTKAKPTFMPTAPQSYTRFIHPGCAPRMKTQ
jgi:hypothetical protein